MPVLCLLAFPWPRCTRVRSVGVLGRGFSCFRENFFIIMSSTPKRIGQYDPEKEKTEGGDISMETLSVQTKEEVWGEEVPDDSKPLFRDDQTRMKPETVILTAPNIYQ